MPFKPGQSGNPGGRPAAEREVLRLARDHSPAAIQKLAEWMHSDNARASIAACVAILDRAFGKPTQPICGDDDHPPVRATVSVEALARLTMQERATLREIARRLNDSQSLAG